MNAAVRVITNTGKFQRGLSYSFHQELRWLDVSERIQFRVAATVYRCLHNMAPRYLSDMYMPIATSARRQGLGSVTTSDLVIPRVRRAMALAPSVSPRPTMLEWSTRLSQVTGSFIWLFQTSTEDISILCTSCVSVN